MFIIPVLYLFLQIGLIFCKQTKMFEGDISVTKNELRKIQKDVKSTGGTAVKFWENGIVPFVISSEFSTGKQEEIYQAMEEISGDTCIQFVQRKHEKDFLFINVGNKCSSKVGKIGGRQEVQMNPKSCMRHGTIVHELIHGIGFWHEQSRTDRDKYITIKNENIKPESGVNFETYENPLSRTYELPYDYASIMHYSAFAFQKRNGLKTIVPKMQDAPIGLRNSMSYFDKLKINLAYKCEDLQ